MEPPPAPPLSSTAAAAAAAAAGAAVAVAPIQAPPNNAYPDSLDSSPRSRNTDSWDESLYPSATGGGATSGPGAFSKLRLMCSYGGHIVPRPHDKSLCYVGGDTRIVVVDRHTTLSDLTHRLSKTLLHTRSFNLKYQLPNEELDSLISVTTDEDLENMIDEYDRLSSAAAATTTTSKSSRLRLFLFSSKSDSASSFGSLLENSTKTEDWFLSALNGATGAFSESTSVNCLLGLDDDTVINPNANSSAKDVETQIESFGNVKSGGGGGSKHGAQDVHSVPDSPMLETTSSFGSASSSPSIANLPPIRVRDEDRKVGIEEQFSQMGVVPNVQQKQDDGGFVVLSSPPTVLTTGAAVSGAPMSSAPAIGEYQNRVFSDEERPEQGMPMGYRKPPQNAQLLQQPQSVPPQVQQKQTSGLDLPSPDSVSSDGSITNPLSRQKPMIYQEQTVQIPSGHNRPSASPVDPKITDPNARVQIQQQLQDPGYLLSTQFEPQHHPQLHQQQTQFDPQHHPQLHQQQTQFDPQHHPQLHHQQQQYIHAGTQYIQHHPTGAVPMQSYYPMYPSQQQHHTHHPAHDQQYPVYYMPARQAQAYNVSVQQPSYSEAAGTVPSTRTQTPPPTAAYNQARNAPKPEMPSGGVYRTATTTAPSVVQVPSSQHQPQYVGFSQMHHPSQSRAPSSAATANYAYEFADPTQAHIYYTQAVSPQMAAQYQTMTSGLSEATAHFPTDNVKQQVRTSQP